MEKTRIFRCKLDAAETTYARSESHEKIVNDADNLWLKIMTYLNWQQWYPQNMPAVEKGLVLKLDLMILVFDCFASSQDTSIKHL